MDSFLADAVTDALEPVQHLEKEWEAAKLSKRIRDYFKKAAKSLDYQDRSWLGLVNDYADSVFSSIFQAIGDRPWLDQVDFIFVLDAGIKEFFPGHVLRNVTQQELQRSVLAAHDRAFEEQRYLPKLWEFLESLGLYGKTRKKAYDSVDEGRKVALRYMREPSSPDEVKAFVSRWVDSALHHLHRCTQGDPASVLDERQATFVFKRLLQEGCMPIPLLAEHGMPPEDWPFIPFAVHAAFTAYSQPRRPRESDRQALAVQTTQALPEPLPAPDLQGIKKESSATKLVSPEPGVGTAPESGSGAAASFSQHLAIVPAPLPKTTAGVAPV
mmetsp:Transcript_23738/g.44852  ORF Transcript_23738/g.44852 Transcript_23738/m.44852 type:complete len:327 (+) Transcript_23738:13-993(+)